MRRSLIPLITRAGFSATTTLKRSDFGLSRFEGLVGDEVQLTIEVEFTRKFSALVPPSRGPADRLTFPAAGPSSGER
jgi:hypothetical protein